MNRFFTLVELMIVVAIIAILAAIAIPAFSEMVVKARFAELPVNVEGLAESHVAYLISQDGGIGNVAGLAYPRSLGSLNKQQVDWTTGTYFDTLGWSPDGAVRCLYLAYTPDLPKQNLYNYGVCDVDDDGDRAGYQVRFYLNDWMRLSSCSGGGFCSDTAYCGCY